MPVKKAVDKRPIAKKPVASKKTVAGKPRVKKAVAKKTITLRSKDGKKLAGSQSLEGKAAPTAKKIVARKSTAKNVAPKKVLNPGELTEDEWIKRFKPQANHLDKNAGWDFGNTNGKGVLFETYGEEEDYVASMNSLKRVWTLLDNNEGQETVVAGMAYVNRMGFFITEVPWDDLNQYWDVKPF